MLEERVEGSGHEVWEEVREVWVVEEEEQREQEQPLHHPHQAIEAVASPGA